MLNRWSAVFSLIVVVLVNAAVPAQMGRKITGTVTGKDEGGVANAQVTYLDDATGEQHQTTTDAKGVFEFARGTSGVVTVRARGYGTLRRSWPPRHSSLLSFELTDPVIISGELVDAATRRGVDGTVKILVRHALNYVAKTARVRGVFRFVDLPPGPAVMYAYADGFAPSFDTMSVEAGKSYARNINLMLEARAGGTVLNADDSPAAGAVVHVQYNDTVPGALTLAGLVRGDIKAGEDGAFELRSLLPARTIHLQAELDGRVSDIVTVDSIAPGTLRRGLVLRME